MDAHASALPARSAPQRGDRRRGPFGPLGFAVLATAAFAFTGASLLPVLADADPPLASEPPRATLRVALSAPREAVSGADLLYAVTVASPVRRPVECLGYDVVLVGRDGAMAGASGQLTCGQPGTLAVPDTFALRLALPEDAPPGEYRLVWRLRDAAVEATRSVRLRAER